MCVVGAYECAGVSICTHTKQQLTNITRLFTVVIWEPRKPELCIHMTNLFKAQLLQ